MSQARRTFRIFVSSTFSDLKIERDALHREVFSMLRELCLQHGCRFQIGENTDVKKLSPSWSI